MNLCGTDSYMLFPERVMKLICNLFDKEIYNCITHMSDLNEIK